MTKLVATLIVMIGTAGFAESFSIVQYGDVHSGWGPSRNVVATNTVPWILAHTNDGVFNIAGVVLTGDCFEDNKSATNNYNPGAAGSYYAPNQLSNDVRIMLDAGLMVFITDGNHDSMNTNGYAGYCHTNQSLAWNTFWPSSWFTGQSYFVTNKNSGHYNNMVMKLSRSGVNLAFYSYSLEGNTNTDQAALYLPQTQWIRQQMAALPNYNAIVCSHYFLGQGATFAEIAPSYLDHGPYPVAGPGRAPIDNGILADANIFAFLSGHNQKLLKGIYITNGVDGHQVTFNQMNTQADNTRNCDWINVMTFDSASSTATCGTFSIGANAWLTNYAAADATLYFTNGFRHTFTSPLPVRPRTFPVFRR